MHDIRAIRDDPKGFDDAMRRRGLAPVSSRLLDIDTLRRTAQSLAQDLQTRRNDISRRIGEAKRRGEETTALERDAVALQNDRETHEKEAQRQEDAVKAALETLPNILDADVPDGADERDNVVVK